MNTDNTTQTETTPAGYEWQRLNTAGALVIRHIVSPPEEPQLAFGDTLSADDVLARFVADGLIDEGFTRFVATYAQEREHLPLGIIAELATAWGIDWLPEGDDAYALCAACDPNLVIWPTCSDQYAAQLAHIIQATNCHADPHPERAADYSLTPVLAMVESDLYNADRYQPEPRWLPTVLCMGSKDTAGLASLLQSLLRAMPDAPTRKTRVSVSAYTTGLDGTLTKLFDTEDGLEPQA